MVKYTYTFATSGDIQTALDNGSLGKPYVAYVTSTSGVDYNTKSVTPNYKAEWNDVYGDHTDYTLTILDSTPAEWASNVKIGTINCWYVAGGSEVTSGAVDIYLKYANSHWEFYLTSDDPETYSETLEVTASTVSTERLSVKQSSDPTDSDWNALTFVLSNNVFSVHSSEDNIPLSLTTINPS